MKNWVYIFITCLVLAGSSCQNLERDYVTTIGKSQIDASYGNVQNEVTSIYSDLPDGTLYIGNAMMASATDEAEHTQETATIQAFNNGSWNAINNPDAVWGKYYKSIRRANQLLTSLGNVNLDYYKLDPSASQQQVYQTRVAEIRRWGFEARFLRAYYYFELVKRYGGVPLLTKALPIDADFSQVSRNSLNDCVKFIAAECDTTAAELPPYASLAVYDANNLGRATKFAALALKSRLLLYAASDLFNTPAWAGGYAKSELISVSGTDRITRWKSRRRWPPKPPSTPWVRCHWVPTRLSSTRSIIRRSFSPAATGLPTRLKWPTTPSGFRRVTAAPRPRKTWSMPTK